MAGYRQEVLKTRCPYAVPACDEMEYNLINTGSEHFVMCTKFQ